MAHTMTAVLEMPVIAFMVVFVVLMAIPMMERMMITTGEGRWGFCWSDCGGGDVGANRWMVAVGGCCGNDYAC